MTEQECLALAHQVGPWALERCLAENASVGESHIAIATVGDGATEVAIVTYTEAQRINEIAKSTSIARLLVRAREVLEMRATPLLMISESVTAVLIMRRGGEIGRA